MDAILKTQYKYPSDCSTVNEAIEIGIFGQN